MLMSCLLQTTIPATHKFLKCKTSLTENKTQIVIRQNKIKQHYNQSFKKLLHSAQGDNVLTLHGAQKN